MEQELYQPGDTNLEDAFDALFAEPEKQQDTNAAELASAQDNGEAAPAGQEAAEVSGRVQQGDGSPEQESQTTGGKPDGDGGSAKEPRSRFTPSAFLASKGTAGFRADYGGAEGAQLRPCQVGAGGAAGTERRVPKRLRRNGADGAGKRHDPGRIRRRLLRKNAGGKPAAGAAGPRRAGGCGQAPAGAGAKRKPPRREEQQRQQQEAQRAQYAELLREYRI